MKKNPASIIISAILILLAAIALGQSLSSEDINKSVSNILGATTQINTPEGYYQVTQVVDGDTFKVDIDGKNQTVRLLAIDTPETVDPRKPVQCFGVEASNHLKSLLQNQSVRFEYDSLQNKYDRYHRLLAYVYLEDGTFINAHMVKEGYAFAYTPIDSDHLEEMRQLEKQARENSQGLWSQCDIQ